MLSHAVKEALIVYYACNHPHEHHMALLTPEDLHIPPLCLLGMVYRFGLYGYYGY